MLKIVLAGAVTSTFATLKKMVEHGIHIAGVLGYEPDNTAGISGYVNMSGFCSQNNIPYYPFKKIGADSAKEILQTLQPDVFFVVGLSQLVPANMLQIAKLGNIGFHPTKLPEGRGRAPMAWLMLEGKNGAANFFLMGEGADDGPLFVQKEFTVGDTDDAISVEKNMLGAIDAALDEWLPELKKGTWQPIPQDESLATYYGKRAEEDGWINWNASASVIDRLIRATSTPNPGAYSFLNDRKLTVYASSLEVDLKIKGVTGSVLLARDNKYLVQAGDGLVWISNVVNEEGEDVVLKVGQRLGYYTEREIYNLKKELNIIKQKLGL